MADMKKVTWITGAVILALAGGGAWWWTQRSKADEVSYRTAKLERGNLQATVSASGAVNPVKQVSVGTQVSGQIKDIYVDFNSEVKAGQLIALIDPETLEYRVRQAQADLDASRAAVLTAQANIAASNAAVSRAKVDQIESQRDLDRQQSLADKQFVAQSVADKARALVSSSTESVKAAQAQLGVTQAQIKSAQANVQQRDAALAQARIDLSRTKITSPVDGIVIKRAIEKGQTVASSLQSPELFVIAQNLSDMQVDASIDESDVGRIRNGQKASFTVDAFPGQTFEGEVRQVRKAALTVANVVTYVAVVGFTNTGNRLLPGMTANVRVVTDQRQDVLKVPNAALRVRIAGVEPAAQGASGAASGAASGTATSQSRFSWMSQAIAQPAGGGGQGGGMAAQRERLVSELQLNDEQKTKLDAIYSDMRPRFATMRDMPDDERAAAREKITAEIRQKINAMLNAEQRTKYQAMIANAPARAPQAAGAPGATPAGTQQGTQATGGNSAATGAAATTIGASPENATNSVATKPTNTGTSGNKEAKNAPLAATKPNAAAAVAGAAVAASAPSIAPGSAAPPATTGGGAGAGAGAGGGGGPLAEFRNRLVTELQLSADQVSKVDAIYAEARPKFGALRDMTAEERPKARERIMADTRAKIGDLLTPEQKPKYAALLAEAGSRTSTRGRIYLMGADGKPVAYNVRLGITDGTSTELLVAPNSPNADVFKEGANVIIGTLAPGAAAGGAAGAGGAGSGSGQRPSGPRMPF
jgi:HlyD family secretion protein